MSSRAATRTSSRLATTAVTAAASLAVKAKAAPKTKKAGADKPAAARAIATKASSTMASSLHDITVKDIKGQDASLKQYAGKVVLVVNVASKCSKTRQYTGLQKVYDDHKDKGARASPRPRARSPGPARSLTSPRPMSAPARAVLLLPRPGLVILGFPCNQFGSQEPGTNAEIEQFCSTKYNVTFPLFDKIKVNGPETAPVYQFLKTSANVSSIGWNFEKFIVDKEGHVVKHSTKTPEDLLPEIAALL